MVDVAYYTYDAWGWIELSAYETARSAALIEANKGEDSGELTSRCYGSLSFHRVVQLADLAYGSHICDPATGHEESSFYRLSPNCQIDSCQNGIWNCHHLHGVATISNRSRDISGVDNMTRATFDEIPGNGDAHLSALLVVIIRKQGLGCLDPVICTCRQIVHDRQEETLRVSKATTDIQAEG